jgi:hypothetical protein
MSNRNASVSTSNRLTDEEDTFEFVNVCYTRTLLESLSDHDLKTSERSLNKHINSLRSKNEKTHKYEVELCYIQDEIARRSKSYMNHKDA